MFNVTPDLVSPSFKTMILSFYDMSEELTVVVVACTVKFAVSVVVPVAPVSRVIVFPSATLIV